MRKGALTLGQQGGRSWSALLAQHNLGEFPYSTGEYGVVRRHSRAVVEWAGTLADPNWNASALTRLGELALLEGELEPGREQLRETARLLAPIGDRRAAIWSVPTCRWVWATPQSRNT